MIVYCSIEEMGEGMGVARYKVGVFVGIKLFD